MVVSSDDSDLVVMVMGISDWAAWDHCSYLPHSSFVLDNEDLSVSFCFVVVFCAGRRLYLLVVWLAAGVNQGLPR